MLLWQRLLLTASLFLTLSGVVHGEAAYKERLQKAEAAHDPKQTQAVLDEWKLARPDDPEYYIAAANDALSGAPGVVISTKPAAKGDFVVADQKTGKAVGSLSAGKPSAASDHRAIDLLVQGLSKAPDRMDIYLGLGTLYQETNDTGALTKDLSDMAAYAKAHPGKLLGREGKPYPEPTDENLALEINVFASHYFEIGTKETDRVFHDLAQLDADAFPNREYGYNLLGIYYTTVDKDPKLALANYERALKIVPDDSLVWINVGLLHAKDGDRTGAATAFHKVVTLNNDAGCVQQAKSELAKLK